MAGQRAQWSGRLGFILAASGSAVGLGNIWKFPYITGENGGGLFVLIYLACIALVGIPIMMAEIMIGRAAQAQTVVAFEKLQGKRTAWTGVGWMGVIAGFIILSYYIVVAGWAMDFTLKSVVNITAPIHDKAETQATSYRATADLEEMRLVLIDRKATKDSKDPIALTKRKVRPSVWKIYERYEAALTSANVINIANIEAVQRAWKVYPAEIVASAGFTQQMETTISDADRSQYQLVRSQLLEKPEFQEKVPEAETLLPELQALNKTHYLEAREHYLSLDDKTIRDEAETVYRRKIIFDEVSEKFMTVAVDGWTSTFWSAIFMLITVLIVSGGITSGIERTCRILMPVLFVLILIMVVYGMFMDGFGEAVSFVFKPDPTKLKASGILEALGHAFFTLSLGMGAMITYGSYQRSKGGLASQSIIIAGLDTTIALLACLMIFPIIFSYDQEAAAGPGLVFMSMPLAFAEIGTGGMLLSILFFGLLVFAALTSAISLLEVVASYFIDKLGWARPKAAWLLGGIIFLFGVFSAFAMDPQFLLDGWNNSFGNNFFDTMDYLASNWMLPLGGLFISLYAGWAMPKKLRNAELEGLAPAVAMGWLILVRFVAPILVIIVLLQKVGILDADELLHGLF